MARSRSTVTKRKPRAKPKKPTHKRKQMAGIPAYAMSVDQFCHAHNINRDTFYELLKVGRAPECMRVGKRRLIPIEAAQRWRARMTETTEATEAAA